MKCSRRTCVPRDGLLLFFASLAGRRSRSVEGRAPRARGAQAGRSHASRRPRRQGQSVRPSVQEPDGEQRAGGRYRLAPRGVAPCVRTGLPLVVRGERLARQSRHGRFSPRACLFPPVGLRELDPRDRQSPAYALSAFARLRICTVRYVMPAMARTAAATSASSYSVDVAPRP